MCEGIRVGEKNCHGCELETCRWSRRRGSVHPQMASWRWDGESPLCPSWVQLAVLTQPISWPKHYLITWTGVLLLLHCYCVSGFRPITRRLQVSRLFLSHGESVLVVSRTGTGDTCRSLHNVDAGKWSQQGWVCQYKKRKTVKSWLILFLVSNTVHIVLISQYWCNKKYKQWQEFGVFDVSIRHTKFFFFALLVLAFRPSCLKIRLTNSVSRCRSL